MNYEQRLIVATQCVFEGDTRSAADAQVNSSYFDVTTTFKPHQIVGLSGLIRRYIIGVNIILGIVVIGWWFYFFAGDEISFADIHLFNWKGDILAVGVTKKDMTKAENSKFQNSLLKKLDSQLEGLQSEVSSEEDFHWKSGTINCSYIRLLGLGTKQVSLVGLGKCPIHPSASAYRSLGESVALAAETSQANNVVVALASSKYLNPELKLTQQLQLLHFIHEIAMYF